MLNKLLQEDLCCNISSVTFRMSFCTYLFGREFHGTTSVCLSHGLCHLYIGSTVASWASSFTNLLLITSTMLHYRSTIDISKRGMSPEASLLQYSVLATRQSTTTYMASSLPSYSQSSLPVAYPVLLQNAVGHTEFIA